MISTLSTETLKVALLELARSDRAFLITLFTEILQSTEKVDAPFSQQAALPVKGVPEGKINPSYRPKDVAVWRKQFALQPSDFMALKPLFTDAPIAEDIIHSLSK